MGTQHDSHEQLEPLWLLVTGPGGTGKSRVFDAWTEFHAVLKQSGSFHLTAPTGVVASNIGGSTTHSEVSLCVKRKYMKAITPQGQKVRSALEDRLASVQTLVVDEVYFLGASDMSVLSEYCSIAKGVTEYLFGRLNMVTCGNPCQLPPPQAKTLFDRELVNCYKTNTLNAGNEAAQYNIKGIQAWHQFDHVVELTEIMRQIGDDILIDLLGHLHKGVPKPTKSCLMPMFCQILDALRILRILPALTCGLKGRAALLSPIAMRPVTCTISKCPRLLLRLLVRRLCSTIRLTLEGRKESLRASRCSCRGYLVCPCKRS